MHEARTLAADARAERVEAIAQVGVFGALHAPFLAQLDAQVHDLVAQIVEIAFEPRRRRRVARPQPRQIAAQAEHAILQPLDIHRRRPTHRSARTRGANAGAEIVSATAASMAMAEERNVDAIIARTPYEEGRR